MVARISDGDVSQWDIMMWLWDQGQHMPSAHHQVVLAYLASKAFYTSNNPENGEIGQVMRAFSTTKNIMKSTAIKSENTVRKVLNDLQEMAYIQREDRCDAHVYGQQPNLIYVLWEMDELRAQVREGKPLPPALRIRPTGSLRRVPERVADVIPLALVAGEGTPQEMGGVPAGDEGGPRRRWGESPQEMRGDPAGDDPTYRQKIPHRS